MEKYKTYFKKDKFAASCGIELVECKAGYAKAQVKITNKHLNGADIVHGGLIFTLADFCFAAAVNAHEQVTLSINASISYFAKGTTGIIIAEAKEIFRSHKLITCDINVHDEAEQLLANFKGTAYITNQKIEF